MLALTAGKSGIRAGHRTRRASEIFAAAARLDYGDDIRCRCMKGPSAFEGRRLRRRLQLERCSASRSRWLSGYRGDDELRRSPAESREHLPKFKARAWASSTTAGEAARRASLFRRRLSHRRQPTLKHEIEFGN